MSDKQKTPKNKKQTTPKNNISRKKLNEKKSQKNTPVIITEIEKMEDGIRWDGYKIFMSDKNKNIVCKISNRALCCEKFGVYCKNKNLDKFIGAEYLGVKIEKKENEEKYEVDGKINILIETNKGTINILLFNEHNGYYSHDYFIQTEFEKENGEL